MPWSPDPTADSYLLTLSMYQEIFGALAERMETLEIAPCFIPAEGADLHYAGNDAPASTTGRFSIRYVQNWIVANAQHFLDPAINRAASAQLDSWNFTTATHLAYAGISASGYRRKRSRNVATSTATLDEQGNAAAVGQKALLNGLVHRFDGTAWTTDGVVGPVDMLDSTLAAPFNMPYGHFEVGDYFSYTLFIEVRNALKALRYTTETWISGRTSATHFYKGGTSEQIDATLAAAKADAEGLWSAMTPEGPNPSSHNTWNDADGERFYWARIGLNPAGTDYDVHIESRSFSLAVDSLPPRAAQVELWLFGWDGENGDGSMFDPNDTGMLYNQWVNPQSAAKGVEESMGFVVGDVDTMPNYPATPSAGNANSAVCYMKQARYVADWEPGFTYGST